MAHLKQIKQEVEESVHWTHILKSPQPLCHLSVKGLFYSAFMTISQTYSFLIPFSQN